MAGFGNAKLVCKALFAAAALLLAGCGPETDVVSSDEAVVGEVGSVSLAASLVGSNVPVNDPSVDLGGFFHAQLETALAVNPNNGTLCTAFNDVPGFFNGTGMIGFASSHDDGASFQDHGQVPKGVYPTLSDPTVVFRRFDSKFYIATLQGSDIFSSLAIWVSNDDCTSFNFVTTIHSDTFDDKPMTVVDNDPASPYYGRIYVGWRNDTNLQISFTYSDDSVTWSTPALLSASGDDVNGVWPIIVPGGKLYVAWSRFVNPNFDIQYVSSVTGGASFSAVGSVVSGAIQPYDAAATTDPSNPMLNGGIKYKSFTQLAAGSDGCVHAVYAVGPNTTHTGDCSDVYYRRSCNGTAWTTPVKVNDDGTATDQWNASLSVGPGGVVSVGYYDRRNDTASNTSFDYYDRVSLDNGATFQPSNRVTPATSPLALEPLTGGNHGDYDMQVQRPGTIFVEWSDDRNVQDSVHESDVFSQKICPQTGCTLAVAPPRLVAPLSVSHVSSLRPLFKVALGSGSTGVRVDVCRDRACTNIVTTLRSSGNSVTPTADLPNGMLFWRAFGRVGSTDGLAPSPTWEFRVTAENAVVKTSSGAEPDFNGDGRADVAIAASNANGGAGKAYVYYSDGSASGIPGSPSRTLLSPAATDTAFGGTVASAGDLNGDGFADLVVGARGTPLNELYVYYGSAGGIASHPGAILTAPGSSATSSFGLPEAVGDVNGDGYADLLAADPSYPVAAGVTGRAYVYFGGASGIALTPSQTFNPPATGGSLSFAASNGSAGDVNGDGFGDAIIAGTASLSPVVLYLGSAAGLGSPTQLGAPNGTLDPSTGIGFGDVNGDGYSEVVLGINVPGASNLQTCLFVGQAAAPGLNPSPIVYAISAGNVHLADMNNDAFDDLVLGQPSTFTTPGSISVYPGSIFGFGLIPASVTIGLDFNNSGFANFLGMIGDVDGDGRLDVGASAISAGFLIGRFYLYRGALFGWLSGLPARTLTGADGIGSGFGTPIAAIN